MCQENVTTNTVIVDKTHAATQTITDSESDNKVDHEQKRRRKVELISPLDKGASRFLDYMIDGFVEDTQDYSDGNEERIDAENA